jgi:putative ubiquitin-RnfH superfamily antitoxin RatB of RatAB toxin-antitoxin module
MPSSAAPACCTVVNDNEPKVEVVYALPDEQVIVELEFTQGLTAIAAVERSGLMQRYPEIAAGELVLGIYGVEVDRQICVEPGDRVEISRPLSADPREMRRELISDGKVMGGADALAKGLKN